jgi:hypothetical protein
MPVYRQLPSAPSLGINQHITITVDEEGWYRKDHGLGKRRVRIRVLKKLAEERFRVGDCVEGFDIVKRIPCPKNLRKVAARCRREWKKQAET